MLSSNLAFEVVGRKTLHPTHVFELKDTKSEENIFPKFLSTVRASYRSIRREIKNKEVARNNSYLTDSVIHRNWRFLGPNNIDDGRTYTEQQTLNSNLTRTDYAMFGSQSSSYENIVVLIEQVKSRLKDKNCNN